MFDEQNEDGQQNQAGMIDKKKGESQDEYLERMKSEKVAYDQKHIDVSEKRRQTVQGMKSGADIEVGQDVQDRAQILSFLINTFTRLPRYQSMAQEKNEDISQEVKALNELGLGDLTLESQISVSELNQLQQRVEEQLTSIRTKLGI